ncbi:MAG: hypothetical protein JSR62_10195 [Nitrospira sp.]|nr:hypothetical protein [Nitrospira sp.]
MDGQTGREQTMTQADESIAEMADKTADAAKRARDYVQEQGIVGVVQDLEILIRRYPLQALLIGLGCGYLLSRTRTN